MSSFQSMRPANGEKDACEKVGNTIVCLHFLSSQADKDGLPEVAAAIDRAIAQIARTGRDIYIEHLQHVVDQHALAAEDFVEGFCHVNDEGVKSQIRNIVRKE